MVYLAGIKPQEANALLRLKTTEIDETPIEDKVPVLCLISSISPEKGEAKVMYIQDYHVLDDSEDMGLPAYTLLRHTQTLGMKHDR